MALHPCFKERTVRSVVPLALSVITLTDVGACPSREQASEEAAGIAEQSGIMLTELIDLAHHCSELSAALEQLIARRRRQCLSRRAQRCLLHRDAQQIG